MSRKEVMRVKFGSHLYGTSTPTSDIDYKAIHLPTAEEILLQRVQDSIHNRRPKAEREKNAPGDVDTESYSLQRYLNLLADGQTGAIDMLFAPDSMLEVSSPLWDSIRRHKDWLLSKKSAAFVGYCRTQANKYGIKGSRVAAAKRAAEFFAEMLEKRGAQEKVWEVVIYFMHEWYDEHTKIVEQPCNKAGDIGTYFECCNRKVDFNATVKQAHEIFSRIYEEYGSRARLAQDNEGIDWKALSHAVRVGTEAIELLTTGHVTLPLPNAAHVLEIKQGKLPYNTVAEEIERLLVDVEAASQTSSLPDQPDRDYIDQLVYREYRDVVLAAVLL